MGAYTPVILDYSTMPTVEPTPTPKRGAPIWLGMLVLYVAWGSTYLGIAVAVDTIPPFLMAAARFLLAGAILLAWSIAREGRSFVAPSRREWRDSAIVGALLLGGGNGLVAYGELTVPSGIAALLVALVPVWVAILGGIFLGDRLPRQAVIGIAIGFAGVAILVGPSALGGGGALDPLGLAACLLAPIAWAAGSLFASRRAALPGRPLVATGLQMLLGGLVLTLMATATGEVASFDATAVTRDSLIAFAYLIVIGSLLAFTVFGWMLRVAPLPLVTTYAYVNPVVAVILGWLVLGETIDARTVLAGAVIVFAVALIVSARGRMKRPGQVDAGDRGTLVGPGAGPASGSVPSPAPRSAPTP
jgi:drug/metabolite transporter (DMT)-like permease